MSSKAERRNVPIFDLSAQYLSGVRLEEKTASHAAAPEPVVLNSTTPDPVGGLGWESPPQPAPVADADELTSHPPDEAERHTCNTCQVVFDTSEDQRNHFRSDWHRLNVKRHLSNRPIVTEETFAAKIENNDDDIESISGSDSADEADPEAHAEQRGDGTGPRVGFVDADGKYFTTWRCVLGGPTTEAGSREQPEAALQRVQGGGGPWVVLLASGGHFAGAVFEWKKGRPANSPPTILAHRTFHRYVVRAGQGGRQSTKDKAGKKIKSAGSNLRRHNEAALARDMQDLMAEWRPLLAQAALLFVQANGANGVPLFAGESPALRREDPRMRRIPFNTRRPTFGEVQRVALALATATYEPRPQAAPPGGAAGAAPPCPAAGELAEAQEAGAAASGEEEARRQAERDAKKKAKDKEKKKAKKKEKQAAAAAAAMGLEGPGGRKGAGSDDEEEDEAARAASAAAAEAAGAAVISEACVAGGGGASVLARIRAGKQAKKQEAAASERDLRAAAAERRLAALSMTRPGQ